MPIKGTIADTPTNSTKEIIEENINIYKKKNLSLRSKIDIIFFKKLFTAIYAI
jgi:hypothetical protein